MTELSTPETPPVQPANITYYESERPDNKAIYCFPPGTSEADKQHDIEQVNLWIEHVKAKKQLTGGKRKRR
jgi:hypothetical protein